MNSKQLTDL